MHIINILQNHNNIIFDKKQIFFRKKTQKNKKRYKKIKGNNIFQKKCNFHQINILFAIDNQRKTVYNDYEWEKKELLKHGRKKYFV